MAVTDRLAIPSVVVDGSFSAHAPMPARLRATNRARYYARVASHQSLKLKLFRRMVVTSLRHTTRTVTITGYVVAPLARRARDRRITLQRFLTCTRTKTVKTFDPKPDDSFRITVPAPQATPPRSTACDQVRHAIRGRHLHETFTLPRTVNVRRS